MEGRTRAGAKLRRTCSVRLYDRTVAVGVVLAAHGYPGEVRTGDVIHGLDDVARDCPDVQLFFAGVKQKGNDLVTSGGRVLTVMATAPSYRDRDRARLRGGEQDPFRGHAVPPDIGRKALIVGN